MSKPERTKLVLEVWSGLEWLDAADQRVKGASRAAGAWTEAVQEQERAIAALLKAFKALKEYLAAETITS